MTFEGPPPAEPADQDERGPGLRARPQGGRRLEHFVGENGGLDNVFVYVKDGLGNYYFDVPTEPVTLDQTGCMLQAARLRRPRRAAVEIVNSDPTVHNVHALPNVEPGVQLRQQIQRQKDTRFFTAPEVMVPFKCDVHGWMSAYAGVLEHPYFAVTTGGGRFELKNVPAGTYTVEAWHEKLGTQTQQVTLGEKDSKDISFTFKALPRHCRDARACERPLR